MIDSGINKLLDKGIVCLIEFPNVLIAKYTKDWFTDSMLQMYVSFEMIAKNLKVCYSLDFYIWKYFDFNIGQKNSFENSISNILMHVSIESINIMKI